MYLKSPLNYTGGKHRLLKQLLPLFPQDIDILVDLFAGGLDIAFNTKAERKLCNDKETSVIDLYKNLQKLTGEEAHEAIMCVVESYGLSKTNAEGYKQLREDYNRLKSWDLFYAAVTHAFSNQIRFNKSGEFNMPFGKDRSWYNPALQKRLVEFTDGLDNSYTFTDLDFREFDFSKLTADSFVYCDPPYLITTAAYNEQGGWTEEDERDLLSVLDELNSRGVKFGLSNVTEMGGRSNEILKEWSKKYTVHTLKADYSNCSYQKKDHNKKAVTKEVFITNY